MNQKLRLKAGTAALVMALASILLLLDNLL
jgi:hypothetical protein